MKMKIENENNNGINENKKNKEKFYLILIFEADFRMEKEGYDYMIKHEKNKFDKKELNETSQKSLLDLSIKNEN
jgi:hypothetical protein